MNFDVNMIRFGFITVLILTSAFFHPTENRLISGLIGLVFASAIIFFETRIRRASLKTLIGGAFGSILGIIGASLIGFLISVQSEIPSHLKSYITVLLAAFMGYVGLIVGAVKGDYIDFSVFGGLLRTEGGGKPHHLILDTSVIIDGRVADIAETGFLGGQLVIPQFMLRELQQVADSADSTKRNRGRRGLDILQRIQKNHNLDVHISDIDFPDIREVDHKLIELAKQLNGKIVTNDFNLNKVAQLRGVQVLNINELANALKPVVLPGEIMRVFVLKEGKEYNQGVAYLDDGTMVVIDNARKFISKNIDISVTSVLQTTAGKMIFGRYNDDKSVSPDSRSMTPDRSMAPSDRSMTSERSMTTDRTPTPDRMTSDRSANPDGRSMTSSSITSDRSLAPNDRSISSERTGDRSGSTERSMSGDRSLSDRAISPDRVTSESRAVIPAPVTPKL